MLGAAAGVVAAIAVLPLLQRFSGTWFGPLEVPWLLVAGVAGLGLVAALLAALAPAVLASRQDVVAVLAGRRGEPKPSRLSPVIGVALLATGVATAVLGALEPGRETGIALAGAVSVVGMVLLVPLVLSWLGRLAGRLPLVLRYAVRDAADSAAAPPRPSRRWPPPWPPWSPSASAPPATPGRTKPPTSPRSPTAPAC